MLEKKMSVVNHPSARWSAGNSWPSVYFCLWKWVFGVLGDKWWGLMKTVNICLCRQKPFLQTSGKCWIKVWLNPCENELEILWGENMILVSIITDVITWLLPEEVLHFRTACISFIFFPDLSSISESILGFGNVRNKTR